MWSWCCATLPAAVVFLGTVKGDGKLACPQCWAGVAVSPVASHGNEYSFRVVYRSVGSCCLILTWSRLMMSLFAFVWTPNLFHEMHQVIAWPKINGFFQTALPGHPAFLPSDHIVWVRTCLPAFLRLCFFLTNVSLPLLLPCFPLLPTAACLFFFNQAFCLEKAGCAFCLAHLPSSVLPLRYFCLFFFLGPSHACWSSVQLRSRNFHVVLGERVSPSQPLPQPGTSSCRNSLATLGNRSVWNNKIILSFWGQKKKKFFYTVIHTLLIPQSLVCFSPPSHFSLALPFS